MVRCEQKIFKNLPNIVKKKDPYPESEKFKEIKEKFKEHFDKLAK